MTSNIFLAKQEFPSFKYAPGVRKKQVEDQARQVQESQFIAFTSNPSEFSSANFSEPYAIKSGPGTFLKCSYFEMYHFA
jgi:hypothetical protein